MDVLERTVESAALGLGVGVGLGICRLFTDQLNSFYPTLIAFAVSSVKAYKRDAPLTECMFDNVVSMTSAFLTYSAINYFL